MGISLAFPILHLPLLLVLAALTAVAIPAWRVPARAGPLTRVGAVCRSVLGRAVLGVVAAIGIYVIAMLAGTILVSALTPAASKIERSA